MSGAGAGRGTTDAIRPAQQEQQGLEETPALLSSKQEQQEKDEEEKSGGFAQSGALKSVKTAAELNKAATFMESTRDEQEQEHEDHSLSAMLAVDRLASCPVYPTVTAAKSGDFQPCLSADSADEWDNADKMPKDKEDYLKKVRNHYLFIHS